MSGFQDRLWQMLVDEHGADTIRPAPQASPKRRRRVEAARVLVQRPVALTAGVLGLAAAVAAAVVLIVSATATTTPAYALTQNPDGSVSVTINDLQIAIPQLNDRFKTMGIDETVIPIAQSCPSGGAVPVYPQSAANDTITLTPGRKYLSPGFDGVLAAGYSSSGQLLVFVGAMKPPLPSCLPPTPAYAYPAPSRTSTTTTSTTSTPTSGS